MAEKEIKEHIFKAETRTAATVYVDDLKLFKALARLKFDSDPVNTAWKESVQLFIRENKHLLKDTYEGLSE